MMSMSGLAGLRPPGRAPGIIPKAPRLDSTSASVFESWVRCALIGDSRTLNEFCEDGGLPLSPTVPLNTEVRL